jgi:hypothetical protein
VFPSGSIAGWLAGEAIMGDYKITRLNVPNFSDAFFGLALFVSLFPVLRSLLLILDNSSTRLL